jgi:protein-S-isoprenylcysteine O-methyltransferase Ste14
MSTGPSTRQQSTSSDLTRGIVRRLVQVAISILVQAAILFLALGDLGWIWAWVYIGTGLVIVLANAIVLLSTDPALIAERGQVKEDAKEWDRWYAAILSLFGPALTLLVAGLDERYGWSGSQPLALHLVGWALFVLGNVLWGWAMASNRFFGGLVRIQEERGHTTATGGPYRFVRHPGYVGMIVFSVGTALLLGSLWALIPVGLTCCAIVARTALEDRTLREELDGYAEYARRVRYRLLPGVW